MVAYLPTEPDLRLGLGLDFNPANTTFLRLEAVEHNVGLSLDRRFHLGQYVELSTGLGAYYDLTDHRLRPALTLGRITF